MNKETPNATPTQNKKLRLKKILPFLLVAASIFILYLLYTVAMPFFLGDGMGKLNGAQKEAAQRSIDYSSRYLDNKTRFAFRYHIDEVLTTTPNEIDKYCKPFEGQVTDNPNDIRHYTIKMTVRELFNPVAQTVIIDGCTAFGSRMDGPYMHR